MQDHASSLQVIIKLSDYTKPCNMIGTYKKKDKKNTDNHDTNLQWLPHENSVCVCVACAFFGSAAVLDADLNLDSIHSWFLHGSQWSDVW